MPLQCTTHTQWLWAYLLIAGLPRARSARGTEPHTHGIWSTSFRLVVTWFTERTYVHTYVRVYRLYGWVGETIKRKGGVSQACLGKSTSLILDFRTFPIWSINSCQNRIATDQYPMTISRDHVSTHRGDVIYSQAVRWPVNCFTRSRTMFNLILLLVKLMLHTYWTSMFWSIDSCQNRVPADQCHLTVSRAQVSTHRGQVFFWSYKLTSY